MSAKFKEGRPKALNGETYLLMTGCGKLYITINGNGDRKPVEVLGKMGKTGGCIASQIEGLSRLTSVALQDGVEPVKLIKHLKGIRCPSMYHGDGIKVSSCSDAIARAMEMFMDDGEVSAEATAPICPKCGGKFKKVDNLLVCDNCAFEKAD